MVFSTCSISIASTDNAPFLTLSKTINDDSGTSIPYTSKPVTITATYDSGSDGGTDKFVKKSWFRVESLDENANLQKFIMRTKTRSL